MTARKNALVSRDPPKMEPNPNQFGPKLDLSNGEVHLWVLPYKQEDQCLLSMCREVLPQAMLERIEHFKFPAYRYEYMVGQAALRILLSRYTGIEIPSLRIERHSKGKPYSWDDPPLQFNMSNSQGLVVFAFARNNEVGVDVERIRPLPEMKKLLNGSFRHEEIQQIMKGPGPPEVNFFRFWTYKESYLKAIGEGMRLTPDNIEFRRENGAVRLLSVPEVLSGEKWYFREFSPLEGYIGTIAYKKKATQIRENRLEIGIPFN